MAGRPFMIWWRTPVSDHRSRWTAEGKRLISSNNTAGGGGRCFGLRQAPASRIETPEPCASRKCAKGTGMAAGSLRCGRFLYGPGYSASTCTSTWRLSFRMRRWPRTMMSYQCGDHPFAKIMEMAHQNQSMTAITGIAVAGRAIW